MNHKVTLGLVLMLVSLLGASLLGGQVMSQPEGLTIFFTGDSNAQVLSCGCVDADYGGASRRAAFLDTLRTGGWEYLTLDVGDISPFKGIDSQSRMKAETLARSMALMEYDAITLGDHDLAPGRQYVSDLIDWLGQRIVATNYHISECETVRSRVLDVQGHRVGILGFLDEVTAAEVAPWLVVETWESQRARVDSVAALSDVLVALVHSPDTSAVTRLAGLFPQVHLILAGHEGIHPEYLQTRGYTAIAGSPSEGRHLGRAMVTFRPDGRPHQIVAAYLPVVESWGRRTAIDQLVGGYSEQVKRLALDASFQEERLQQLQEPAVEFVGTDACASCHTAETEQWKTTLHSHAHETLVLEESDHDPDCQRCHTVGFGYRTGFATPEATPDRWNVGCESCHGGGALHVENPEAPYGATSEETCVGCHTAHNSPAFDYSTYRPKIVHD